MNTCRSYLSLLLALFLSGVFTLVIYTDRACAVDFELRPTQGNEDSIIVGVQQEFLVEVIIQNDIEVEVDPGIQGFQLAIGHDPQFLDIQGIDWRGTDLQSQLLRGGEGPEFFLENPDPTGGTGVTLGVIFQNSDLSFLLSKGEHRVARVMYVGRQLTIGDQTTQIFFEDSLGEPSIKNKYTTSAGVTQEVDTTRAINVSVADVTYSIHFGFSVIGADANQDFSIPIELINSPLKVYGFSFGVTHDANFISFKELKTGGSLLPLVGDISGDLPLVEDSPFFALNSNPSGGDGFTVALILNSSDPSVFLDPDQSPHALFDIVYTAGAQDTDTDISISEDLGSPPVKTVFDLFSSVNGPVVPQPPPPTTVTASIGGGSIGAPFFRGDVDQNGRANIADVTPILQYLFNVNSIVNPDVLNTIDNCLAVLNVNGSVNSQNEETAANIDLPDVIWLHNFMFKNGPAPKAPFPNCGQPETTLALDFKCQSFSCR